MHDRVVLIIFSLFAASFASLVIQPSYAADLPPAWGNSNNDTAEGDFALFRHLKAISERCP